MGHQEILNLLNESSESEFVKRKWNIVSDKSNANYDVVKGILVKGDITVVAIHATQVPFKNCAPFT